VESASRPVIWGAILALAVVAVLLAIFAGAIGAVICAVVAIGLALFSTGLRRS
jgi:hypothetical protein